MNTIPYIVEEGEHIIDPLLVEGAKKGGSSSSSSGAKEDPNSLKSNAIATVLIAVSEGEIAGFTGDNPAKGIYFDQTPLMNANNTLNFQGVTYDYRVGLASQPPINGISDSEDTIQVNSQVKANQGPLVKAVSSKNIDSVRIVVQLPALVSTNSKTGDSLKTSVQFKFEVFDEIAQVWTDRGTYTISGKCTAPYQIAYRIQRPAGSARWLVRMTRITADGDSTYMQNDTYWAYMTEIQDQNLPFNNTAYVMVRVSIKEFSDSIPKLSFKLSGIKVQVPNNYNQANIGTVGANVYSGAWNGTFKLESTDNPVWQIYNLLTNSRYGMQIDPGYINIYDWIPLAKYCDGVDSSGNFVGVDDGKGGKRARFTCRTQITNQDDAMSVINSIASCMRAITYWGAGSVQLSMDMPKSPLFAFGETNVIDGNFSYSSTSLGDLYTRANVTFNNPDNFYEQDVATYIDKAAEAKYQQRIQTDVVKYGCTNEAEAYAFARWLVDTAQTQTDTVSFSIGGADWSLRPGDVFTVSDKFWANTDLSGRLSGTMPNTQPYPTDGPLGPGSVYDQYVDREFNAGYYEESFSGGVTPHVLPYFKVKLDKPVTLTAGATYTMTIAGTRESVYWITGNRYVDFVVHSMTTFGSPTDIIYLYTDSRFPPNNFLSYTANGQAFNEIMNYVDTFGGPLTFWSIRSNKFAPRQFTCMNIKEKRTNEFEVIGVIYDPNKFARVESNTFIAAIPSRIPVAGSPAPTPRGLTFKVNAVVVGGVTQNNLIVNWPFVNGAIGYKVSYSFNGGSMSTPVQVDVPEFDVNNAANGVYHFSVTSVNALGAQSTPVVGDYTLAINNNAVTPGGSVGGDTSGNTGQPATSPTTSTSTIGPPTSVRLQTIGGTAFVTQDCAITWTAPTIPTGMTIQYYDITIINNGTSTVRRHDVVSSGLLYTYTFSMNTGDTLARSFGVQVRAVDNLGNFTAAGTATFTNAAPSVPALVSVVNSANTLTLTHATPSEADAQGTIICADATTGFTPSTMNKQVEEVGTVHNLQVLPNSTYFFRYAIYDSFSDDPTTLIFSAEQTLTTGPDSVKLDPILGMFDAPQIARVYPLMQSAQDPFAQAKLWGKTEIGTGTLLFRVNGVVKATLPLTTTTNSISFVSSVSVGDKTDLVVSDKSSDGVGFSWQLDCGAGT